MCIMKPERPPIVFTPDNEPYLGRELLFHFDELICSALDQNAITAPYSHKISLSEQQKMACQVIAQALNIALAIRELVRQGYLFGAHVLVRSLVERSAILYYIHLYPNQIELWTRGWQHREAPTLAKMLDSIQAGLDLCETFPGKDLTAAMNSLLHAKPDSAPWALVSMPGRGMGHAVSKILNRPDLCDELCASVIPWLVIVQSMMNAYFPGAPTSNEFN
jgi:hypothetical protein